MAKAIKKKDPKLSRLEKRVQEVYRDGSDLQVTSNQGYLFAAGFYAAIRSLRKEISALFDPVVSKAQEALRGTREHRDKYDLPLAEIEEHVKGLIVTYVEHQETQRRRVEEALNSAAKEKGITVPAIVPSSLPEVDGFFMKQVLDWDVEDAALVPREYLSPDSKKIGEAVRALRGQANIPGIRIKTAWQPAARTP